MTDKDLSISKQVAIEVAIICAEQLNIEMDSNKLIIVANKLTQWIAAKGGSKETLIQRQAALKRAALSVRILKLNSTKEILEQADVFYNYFK